MALIKPIAKKVSAFDATKEQKFSFTSNGGNQVVANKLTIRNQDDNSIVYQNKVDSYLFEQTLPTNVLTNGIYYNFYFNTYDAQGEESVSSDALQFYCFSTPTLTFTNLPPNNLIDGSNYNFSVQYNQTEGELVDTLKFYLYDSFDNIISESEIYNGTATLPTVFSHLFNGFENNITYKVQVVAQTVNGMSIATNKYSFMAKYYYPQLYSLIELQNDCNNGCVRLESNIIMADGETKTTPVYVNSMLDATADGQFVLWEQGFSFGSDFTLTTFAKIGYVGDFAILGTQDNGYVMSIVREYPYGQDTPKDCVELKGYVNGELKVLQRSNLVDLLNSSSYYMIWLRKVGDTYDFRIDVLETTAEVFEWGNSNIEYGKMTNLFWKGEGDYSHGSQFVPMSNSMEEVFPITKIKIFNAMYDDLDISANVTSEYSTTKKTWNYDTRFNCNFNGNVSGGNIDTLLSSLKYIRVKRRKQGSFDWVTLKQIEIQSYDDIRVAFEDYYVPNNYKADYAIVPVTDGGVEGDYISSSIDTRFSVFTIADINNVFKLRANIGYSGDKKNKEVGTYKPMSGLYPILQSNSELNYYSGSVSATLLGYKYDTTKIIDRQDIIKQTQDLCEFLTDMNAKVIKDWNGNIHLVRFLGEPSITYDQKYGNGIATVTANWIEQGQFNNQADLYENGLIIINE